MNRQYNMIIKASGTEQKWIMSIVIATAVDVGYEEIRKQLVNFR